MRRRGHDEPPVNSGTVPPSTSELVLVVSDPDAPGGTFVHLTRYELSPRGQRSLNHGGREGRNSAGKVGWTPPCPPKGDGRHVRSPGVLPKDVVNAVDGPHELDAASEQLVAATRIRRQAARVSGNGCPAAASLALRFRLASNRLL